MPVRPDHCFQYHNSFIFGLIGNESRNFKACKKTWYLRKGFTEPDSYRPSLPYVHKLEKELVDCAF